MDFRRAFPCWLLMAVALLALPAATGAHQAASLGGGQLTITGDHPAPNGDPKPNDLIVLSYDAAANELVAGNDIFSGTPSQCHDDIASQGLGVIHCPAALVSQVTINAGDGNNKFVLGGLIDSGTPNQFASPNLLSVNVVAGAGNDNLSTFSTARALGAPTFATSSAAGPPVVMNFDMGTGNDVVRVGGGTFEATFGSAGNFTAGNGHNVVTMGAGSSTVTVGDGTNVIKVGSGNSKVTVGDGTNTAIFGRGNSKYFGGAGFDDVTFKGGNDKFFGEAGDDRAKMGAGRDKAFGGPGKDTLKGNGGVDKLIGGGGVDKLIGGGGGDKCIGGGGGARTVGCEHG
jgi:Ca2+-binding RTX toxin-like protein